MSDSDFISMSSNRKNVNKKIIKKNVRFKHFCLKMRALEKWCVTKVAHCMLQTFCGKFADNVTGIYMMTFNYRMFDRLLFQFRVSSV